MRTHVLLPLLLLIASCGSATPHGTPDFPADVAYAAPDVPLRNADNELRWFETHEDRIAKRLAATDVVFVGRVLHVGPSPGVYSGVLVVHQRVLYRVEEVWKGRAPAMAHQRWAIGTYGRSVGPV